jgi:hypothetical protein
MTLPDGKGALYLESKFQKTHVQLSPDGRWLAYASNESGSAQIVVQSFPDPKFFGRRDCGEPRRFYANNCCRQLDRSAAEEVKRPSEMCLRVEWTGHGETPPPIHIRRLRGRRI